MHVYYLIYLICATSTIVKCMYVWHMFCIFYICISGQRNVVKVVSSCLFIYGIFSVRYVYFVGVLFPHKGISVRVSFRVYCAFIVAAMLILYLS